MVANITKSTGANKNFRTLKHQQLMNMKMELVERKLPKNFVSLKVKSQDELKTKKT